VDIRLKRRALALGTADRPDAQPAKTTLFAWPVAGGGNGADVRKKPRRRLFANELRTEAHGKHEQSGERGDPANVGGCGLAAREARVLHGGAEGL